MRSRADLPTYCGWLALVALVAATSAHGQVTVFRDTFDRPNDVDIDASSTGMSGLVAPATYREISDTILTTMSTLTKVEGNQLYLAFGPNASVVHPDVNFASPTTTSLSVSLDLVSNRGDAEETNQRWVGFGFGGTQAEAEAARYDFNSTSSAPGWKGNQSGTALNSGFADFFVAWERVPSTADNLGRIAVYRNGVRGTIFNNGGANYVIGGTLDVDLSFANFSAGTTVSAAISYGGATLGVESFSWDHSNANYIGLSARQNLDGWLVDNFVIEANAFTPVQTGPPTLVINRDTGNITLENRSSTAIHVLGYAIETGQGGFNTTAWNRVDALDVDDSWDQLTLPGSPTRNLSEATLGAGYILDAAGGTHDSIDFGDVWVKSPFEDLSIEVLDVDGAIVPITIVYEGNGGNAFKLCDYDFDADADGADFLAWQRGFGSLYGANELANWRTAFGPPGSTAAAVEAPEPSTWALMFAATGATLGRRRAAPPRMRNYP